MKPTGKSSIINDTPSWVQSFLWVIFSTLVLFGLGEGVGNIFKINAEIAGAIPYVVFDVLIAVGCFYIVKWNPKSLWYVPLICNAVGIIAAFAEPTFWRTPLWIIYSAGLILSYFAAFMGSRVAKKHINALHR